MAKPDLTGRTCVVTGATSGIGEETALGLAKLGARVMMVGRSPERGEAALARVRAESGNDAVELLLADLSRQKEVRELGHRLLASCDRVHVLVNNAGIVNLRRTVTEDALETTFAVNHLAYFLLTHLLLVRLKESAPSRVVNVASDAHKFGSLDFEDLQSERKYGAMRAYGTSKLANIHFTYELARRLDGTGVTVNCVHPGAVATRLGKNNGRLGRAVTAVLKPFFLSPEAGARTSIYAASAPELEGVTGRYFVRCREATSSPASHDRTHAKWLWEASDRLTGLTC